MKSIKDFIVKDAIKRIVNQKDNKLKEEQFNHEFSVLSSFIKKGMSNEDMKELSTKINSFIFGYKSMFKIPFLKSDTTLGESIIKETLGLKEPEKETVEVPKELAIREYLIDIDGQKVDYKGFDLSHQIMIDASTEQMYLLEADKSGLFKVSQFPPHYKPVLKEQK